MLYLMFLKRLLTRSTFKNGRNVKKWSFNSFQRNLKKNHCSQSELSSPVNLLFPWDNLCISAHIYVQLFIEYQRTIFTTVIVQRLTMQNNSLEF